MLLLPLTPENDFYEMEFLFDGVDVVLRFQYNERDDTHYLSVFRPEVPADTDGSRPALVAGLPILSGQSLWLNLPVEGLPPGVLFALDTQNKDKDAGRGELGARVKVFYVTAEELAAIRAAPNG